MDFTSERNPASQLPESGLMRQGGLAKIRVWEVHVDPTAVHTVSVPCVVGPVKQIEELKSKLEVDPFGNVGVFVKIHIRLNEVRAAKLLRFLVSFLSEGWNCEVVGRDCTREPGSVVMGLAIA